MIRVHVIAAGGSPSRGSSLLVTLMCSGKRGSAEVNLRRAQARSPRGRPAVDRLEIPVDESSFETILDEAYARCADLDPARLDADDVSRD